MGLDLFFSNGQNAPDESQYARVGYFRKVNPLLKWVDEHVGLVRNQVLLEVTKAHLQALLSDLQSLTPDNCGAVYPTIDGFSMDIPIMENTTGKMSAPSLSG